MTSLVHDNSAIITQRNQEVPEQLIYNVYEDVSKSSDHYFRISSIPPSCSGNTLSNYSDQGGVASGNPGMVQCSCRGSTTSFP